MSNARAGIDDNGDDISGGPIVTAAALAPGHDGRAEIVVELAYANGGRTTLSLAQEVVGRIVDAAGLTRVEDLVGQSWTMLVLAGGLPFLNSDRA